MNSNTMIVWVACWRPRPTAVKPYDCHWLGNGTWCRIGRRFSTGGSWVRPPRRDLGQVLHSQFLVALRRETPTQCLCCSRECHRVVVDLKRHYSNILNEWIIKLADTEYETDYFNASTHFAACARCDKNRECKILCGGTSVCGRWVASTWYT